MRTIGKLGWWAAGGSAICFLLGLASAGCFTQAGDCKKTLTCEGSTEGAGGQSGAGGQGGTGGAPPEYCDNNPTTAGSVVDECGVFVDGNVTPGGNGTREKPFATFGEATQNWPGKPRRIFACKGDVVESATVVLADTYVIGGFADCDKGTAGWTWADGNEHTKLKGVADVPVLQFDGGSNGTDHLDVIAPDAVQPGASSIAVVAGATPGTTLTLKDAILMLGKAKAGANGEVFEADASLDGVPGKVGLGACEGGVNHPGGMALMTATCPDGQASISGAGGDGHPSGVAAGAGGDGTPDGGKGGKGQMGIAMCANGMDGMAGGDGANGLGATGDGKISVSGYEGAAGEAGKPGVTGKGAGGGGASEGSISVLCSAGNAVDVPGASGGSGGTGACGGKGGGGGQAGGSSIGIIALGAAVSFKNASIAVGTAGAGGKGAIGQPGGTGGSLGVGGVGVGAAKKGCNGGTGGNGGNGGVSGGGRGGHALGIAYTETAPNQDDVTITLPKDAAKGGEGGMGNDADGNGAEGLKIELHAFN